WDFISPANEVSGACEPILLPVRRTQDCAPPNCAESQDRQELSRKSQASRLNRVHAFPIFAAHKSGFLAEMSILAGRTVFRMKAAFGRRGSIYRSRPAGSLNGLPAA